MSPGSSKPKSASQSKVVAADSPRASAMPASDSDLESLRQRNADLVRTAQYRSMFLARLAHELRTPLTSILGFSEILLSQEKLTEAQRGFCERIQSSAQQLQVSLNQLSDLARLEAGETKLTEEKIALGETLRDVLPALARSAEKKRLRLGFEADADMPLIVSDHSRVRLVIYNLLAHAISVSPERGLVRARAKLAGDGVAISVRNQGDPIPDPSRLGIIDADDNSSTGELGLSIARQNVEILGGSITAHNGDGEVEVTVNLPLELPR